MVFKSLWMSILIKWCFKWMKQTSSIALSVSSSSKSFERQETSCFKFSTFIHSFYAFQLPLFFNHHFPFGDLFIIVLFVSMCHIDPLVRPFFALIIFMLCIVFRVFFLHVSFVKWRHPYPRPCPCSYLCFLSFCFTILIFLWGWMFNFTNAWFWVPFNLPLGLLILIL